MKQHRQSFACIAFGLAFLSWVHAQSDFEVRFNSPRVMMSEAELWQPHMPSNVHGSVSLHLTPSEFKHSLQEADASQQNISFKVKHENISSDVRFQEAPYLDSLKTKLSSKTAFTFLQLPKVETSLSHSGVSGSNGQSKREFKLRLSKAYRNLSPSLSSLSWQTAYVNKRSRIEALDKEKFSHEFSAKLTSSVLTKSTRSTRDSELDMIIFKPELAADLHIDHSGLKPRVKFMPQGKLQVQLDPVHSLRLHTFLNIDDEAVSLREGLGISSKQTSALSLNADLYHMTKFDAYDSFAWNLGGTYKLDKSLQFGLAYKGSIVPITSLAEHLLNGSVSIKQKPWQLNFKLSGGLKQSTLQQSKLGKLDALFIFGNKGPFSAKMHSKLSYKNEQLDANLSLQGSYKNPMFSLLPTASFTYDDHWSSQMQVDTKFYLGPGLDLATRAGYRGRFGEVLDETFEFGVGLHYGF